MKKMKMDWNNAPENRLNRLNDIYEFCLKAYESSTLYKENTKNYRDQHIEERNFVVGILVLLFNSRLRLFQGKLKSRWTSPFLISQIFPHGVV